MRKKSLSKTDQIAAAINRLPSSLKIGAFDYSVVTMTESEGAGRRVFGEFRPMESEIAICLNSPSLPKLVDTVMHEVLHAVWWHAALDRPNEEEGVLHVARTLTMVFRDNPELLRWLQEALGQ